MGSSAMSLNIATCQFPVSRDVSRNTRYVIRQIRQAGENGADIVHSCEGALSGYAGVDFDSFDEFDWALLELSTRQILEVARDVGVWVLLGSSHRLSRGRKPHNSVYLINDRGEIVDRYDKRFCAGDSSGKTGDLAHYTPGDYSCVFKIRGIRCAVLICHDYRYPELYREYKRKGADVLFHSFHAGNLGPEQLDEMQAAIGKENFHLNNGTTYPEITMPATMQSAAASSHLWISCSNTSARHSCWPAFFVRADGIVTGRLRKGSAGILMSTVDLDRPLYDSTRPWRDRAMRGVLHSGRTVRDARSRNRREL
jgi:predicted amidohydrolase